MGVINTDGGLHPAVDGQSLDEMSRDEINIYVPYSKPRFAGPLIT